MVAYAKHKQWKREESERLRGGRDQIKFIDLRFERLKFVDISVCDDRIKNQVRSNQEYNGLYFPT